MSAIRHPVPGGVPAAGTEPPGDPGVSAAAGRRRDRGRPLSQAGPGPLRELPAGVGRAGRLVALLLHRGHAAATLTERGGEAVWTGHAPAGLPSGGDPLAARAGDPAAAAHAAGRGTAAVHLRVWSDSSATTRCGGSSGCPTATSTTSSCPSWPSCSPPIWPCSTTTTARCGWSPTRSTSTTRDERVDEAYADAVSRVEAMTEMLARATPSSVVSAAFDGQRCRSAGSVRRSSSRARSPRRWRRSRRARPSRSWSASGSRSTPPPTRSTSTGCCG